MIKDREVVGLVTGIPSGRLVVRSGTYTPMETPPPPRTSPARATKRDRVDLSEVPEKERPVGFEMTARVKFIIEVDGSTTVSLMQSSGNENIDKAVLKTMRLWKWEPAYKSGKPVKSTETVLVSIETK